MSENSHHGHARSWVAVVTMWIGFLAGGIAMVTGPMWWLFWVGAGIIALGGIIGVIGGIWDDVVLDGPRVFPEAMHHSATRYPDAEHLRVGLTGEDNAEQATASDPQTTRPHG
jgi:hypothetical protein